MASRRHDEVQSSHQDAPVLKLSVRQTHPLNKNDLAALNDSLRAFAKLVDA